ADRTLDVMPSKLPGSNTASDSSNSSSARQLSMHKACDGTPPAGPAPGCPWPGARHNLWPRDTERRGHRLGLQVLSHEPEDHHAVVVSRQYQRQPRFKRQTQRDAVDQRSPQLTADQSSVNDLLQVIVGPLTEVS